MLDTDTAGTTSSGLWRGHRFGGHAKRVLVIAAAFTLLAGGTALASESGASTVHPSQAAAQSLLDVDTPDATEVETPDAVEVEAPDAVEVEAPEVVDPSTPDNVAQGVHGACVSKVAQDASTVGRAHGLAVSNAAHSCAGKATSAQKSAAGKAKAAQKSAAGKAKAAQKSAAGNADRRS